MNLKIKEIKAEDLNCPEFRTEKIREIEEAVGQDIAINALSGGVDSSVVTVLGHLALGDRLKTYFIDNGLMRKGEPESVLAIFKKNDIPVTLADAHEEFFAALKGVTAPEEKREAIT